MVFSVMDIDLYFLNVCMLNPNELLQTQSNWSVYIKDWELCQISSYSALHLIFEKGSLAKSEDHPLVKIRWPMSSEDLPTSAISTLEV